MKSLGAPTPKVLLTELLYIQWRASISVERNPKRSLCESLSPAYTTLRSFL